MLWQGPVNPPLLGANRFDPYHLHQILPRSYNGYYVGLSIRTKEFDPPTRRHIYFLFQSSTAVVQLTVNQLVVGSIPASGANLPR